MSRCHRHDPDSIAGRCRVWERVDEIIGDNVCSVSPCGGSFVSHTVPINNPTPRESHYCAQDGARIHEATSAVPSSTRDDCSSSECFIQSLCRRLL